MFRSENGMLFLNNIQFFSFDEETANCYFIVSAKWLHNQLQGKQALKHTLQRVLAQALKHTVPLPCHLSCQNQFW